MDDWQLLRDYVERNSEVAFRTLVEHHVGLVYSAALRQVQDAQLAEEVAQAVFILLAQKARTFHPEVVLPGWLFRTTRFVAGRALRTEQRRQRREQEAFAMQQLTTADDAWKRISPAIDEALESLGAADRDAVLIRFFNDKSHRETAAALGISEDAAKKRVTRALEKMRTFFTRRGVSLSATVLAAAVAANAAKAASSEVVATVSAKVFGGSAATATLPPLVTQTLAAWRWAKLKVAGLGVALGTAAIALMIAVTPKETIQSGGFSQVSPPAAVETNKNNARTAATPKRKPAAERAMRFRVVASDNEEAVAYARLSVQSATSRTWENRFDLMTDESGVCDVPLPSGLGRLDVGVAASGWEARFATWKLDTDKEFPAEYVLRVQRVTNAMGGWLRDEAGQVVAGAEVWLQFGSSGDASWRETPRERQGTIDKAPVAKSDAAGRWSCAVMPPEVGTRFSFEVRHQDFPTTSIDGAGDELLRQLLAGTQVATLRRGLALVGRVIDEAGRPISAARIHHRPETTEARVFKVDADGKFTISNLRPGIFPITVTAPGYAPECRGADVQPGMGPLSFQLGPAARLRLRVVDEQGAAVPNATVGLQQWGDFTEVLKRHALKWSGNTGPDGRLEWDSAPPAENLELYAKKDGWCYTRNIQVVAGDKEHTIELRRTLRLTGNVVDADTGSPISEFKVFPGYGEGRGEGVWERLRTQRGEDGSFKLTFEENRQPWRVRIEAEGYEPATSKPLVPDFAGPLEIALQRTSVTNMVRGSVLLPDGRPAAGAQVALLTFEYSASLGKLKFDNTGQSVLTNTDAHGSFAFRADPRAHSVAAVHAAGFARLRVKSPQEPVSLKLQPWGRIEGTVAASARTQPIDSVALMDDLAWNYRGSVSLNLNDFSAKLDDDGHFTFEQVPPGQFSLYLNRGMGIPMACRTEVSITARETAVVQLGGKGVTVVGRFRSKPGQIRDWAKQTVMAMLQTKTVPPPTPPQLNTDEDGATTWAVDFWQSEAGREYSRANRGFSLVVSADGSFRGEQVEPGEYTLMAVVGGASISRKVSVTTAAGETDIGTFDLPDSAPGTEGSGGP